MGSRSLFVVAFALVVAVGQRAPPPGSHGNEPVWVDGRGQPTETALAAIDLLHNAALEGLDPADYRLPHASEERAAFNSQLTASVLAYLHDLHVGRIDPRRLGWRVSSPPDTLDYPALLRDAVASNRLGDLVAALTPASPQYARLRVILRRYRMLAADETLVFERPAARALRPGDPYSGAASLGRLLRAFGDLPAEHTPHASYDPALVEGVKRFQTRHGLDVDGVIGAKTKAALATPLADRVRQIALSLEQIRWLPELTDEHFVLVNIPMFRAWAWNGGRGDGPAAVATGVIVGRSVVTETPVLFDEIESLLFRPYWNVPRSILRAEILPKLARDPGYLGRENMEWVAGGNLRQRPGPQNALGLLKFEFPNEADVYMHDTPARSLFSKSRRDFSHGCVRVEDAIALAEWALHDQPEWNRERIIEWMNGTDTRRVRLTRPIPVFLLYLTAFVSPDDGLIHFSEDYYHEDARLEQALAARQR